MIALGSGRTSIHQIDQCVRNLLNLSNKLQPLGIPENAPERGLDSPETSAQLRQVAASGIVLLKNENNLLPFDKTKKIAVIGPNAKFSAYSGGGSRSLSPYYARTPFEGITAQADTVTYALGGTGYKMLPDFGMSTQTPDGRAGIKAKFYNEPPDAPFRNCIDEVYSKSTDILLVDYKNPRISSDVWYMDLEGTFTPEEDHVYLFGLCVSGTAKFFIDSELIVDNTTNQKPGDTYFGSGTIEEVGSKDLKAGTTYDVHLQFGSALTSSMRRNGVTTLPGGGVRLGCARSLSPSVEIQQAVDIARAADLVLICAGLTNEWEAEGADRRSMNLPNHQDVLIPAVAAANPNTALVIQSGTPIAMPWLADVPAVVWAGYGGNETGTAIADVILGRVTPTGKLPLSFPIHNEDNPAFLNYRAERGRVLYGEDIYIGYRFYEKLGRPVNFPFGHGLSYTTFEMWDLSVAVTDASLKLTLTLANTGDRDGAEVVQAYVSQRLPSINRPVKELAGFKKVQVVSGGKARVELGMDKRHVCSFWDEERGMWTMEEGVYDILVGNSSAYTPLIASFTVAKTVWWSGL